MLKFEARLRFRQRLSSLKLSNIRRLHIFRFFPGRFIFVVQFRRRQWCQNLVNSAGFTHRVPSA